MRRKSPKSRVKECENCHRDYVQVGHVNWREPRLCPECRESAAKHTPPPKTHYNFHEEAAYDDAGDEGPSYDWMDRDPELYLN